MLLLCCVGYSLTSALDVKPQKRSLPSQPSPSLLPITKHRRLLFLLPTVVHQTKWFHSISDSYARRVAADPSFPQKSVAELLLAAGTQLTAEWNRRGALRLLPELDFVMGGVLTAMAGKYYAMWRVAPTTQTQRQVIMDPPEQDSSSTDELRWGNLWVPTTAFQLTMSDGVTRPTPWQRVGAFLAPMPYLFRAGVISSAFGYGVTALFIWIRSILLPTYQAPTQSINILYASLYTGGFLAVVSNIRYQLLQGIVEPRLVNPWYTKNKVLYTILSVSIRLGNGFLGSMLGIMGMRRFGLQRMK